MEMASVHRDPRSPKGVWYGLYRKADGTRAFRSTGKYFKREAQIVCSGWQSLEDDLASQGGAMPGTIRTFHDSID